MPTVATFDGIKIMFYNNEHPQPHFHAKFTEHQAVIDLETMTISQGFMPVAQKRKVLFWSVPRKAQLLRAFGLACNHDDLELIA